MVESTALKSDGELGVGFENRETRYQVRFGTAGETSGRIKIERSGTMVVNSELTRSVQL